MPQHADAVARAEAAVERSREDFLDFARAISLMAREAQTMTPAEFARMMLREDQVPMENLMLTDPYLHEANLGWRRSRWIGEWMDLVELLDGSQE